MSAETETYIYGVVAASGVPVVESRGVGPLDAPVHAVAEGDLAALVSDVPAGSLQAGREDLRRHMDVLQEAIAVTTVVPLRFGTVMPGDDAVREQLLDARGEALARLLETLDGRVELTLKGIYDESVFAQIVRENADIAALRERVAQVPEAASYYDRIRLGELVDAELSVRRDRDASAVLSRLGDLADDVRVGGVTHERGALNASFLVARRRLAQFDAATSEVADAYEGRIAFRYAGPLPPFSFASLDEEPAWA